MTVENVTQLILQGIAHLHKQPPHAPTEQALLTSNKALKENAKLDRNAIALRLGHLMAESKHGMRPRDDKKKPFNSRGYAAGQYLFEQGCKPENITMEAMKSLNDKMQNHRNVIAAQKKYSTLANDFEPIAGPPPIDEVKGSHICVFNTEKLLDWHTEFLNGDSVKSQQMADNYVNKKEGKTDKQIEKQAKKL